jgi:hypothetical protein
MQSRCVLALALAGLAMTGSAGIAAAGPAPTSTAPGIADIRLLTPVHGCHHSYKWGWVPQWGVKAKHKHVGPNCWPKGKGWDGNGWYEPPHGWHPGPWGPGCIKFGPIWYCPPD